MKMLAWLEQDRRLSVINSIGWVLIIASHLISGAIDYFPSDIACTTAYCRVLAIGFIFVSFTSRKVNWFLESCFIFSIYHLLDELLGRGCINDKFEYIGALLTLFYNWKTWKV